jgi:hypothetical protein
VWIGQLGGRGGGAELNPPTRGAAADALVDLLVSATRRGERVLVGFDFPLAFPRGLAAALGLGGAAWDAVWKHVGESLCDEPISNRNNRFRVAATVNATLGYHVFWGCPPRCAGRDLSARRDRARYRTDPETVGPAEWREVECLLIKGGARPHSAWQLLGAGSVGGQALTGIPVVRKLRHHPELAAVSRVWPFEAPRNPDLQEGTPAVVHAEVWPSLIGVAVAGDEVKDRAQVAGLARRLREIDRRGKLSDVLAAAPPAADEEGWILGVGCDGANLLSPPERGPSIAFPRHT